MTDNGKCPSKVQAVALFMKCDSKKQNKKNSLRNRSVSCPQHGRTEELMFGPWFNSWLVVFLRSTLEQQRPNSQFESNLFHLAARLSIMSEKMTQIVSPLLTSHIMFSGQHCNQPVAALWLHQRASFKSKLRFSNQSGFNWTKQLTNSKYNLTVCLTTRLAS